MSQPHDLLLTEDRLAARKESENARRQELEDLAEICRLPAGQRAITRILVSLGFGQLLHADNIQLANFAVRIFERVSQASPAAAHNILDAIYGVSIRK